MYKAPENSPATIKNSDFKNRKNTNDLSLGLTRDESLPKNILDARKAVKTQNVCHGGGVTTEPQKKFIREVILQLMKDYSRAKADGVCQGVVRHHDDGPGLDFDNLETEMMKVMGKVEAMTRDELWEYRTRVSIYENEIYRQMGWDPIDTLINSSDLVTWSDDQIA